MNRSFAKSHATAILDASTIKFNEVSGWRIFSACFEFNGVDRWITVGDLYDILETDKFVSARDMFMEKLPNLASFVANEKVQRSFPKFVQLAKDA